MRKIYPILALATTVLAVSSIPAISFAGTTINQGAGSAVIQQANYFGNTDPNTPVTIDIVMKVQNQDALAQFIKGTTTPGSLNYRKYLSPDQFKAKYSPASSINMITKYLLDFGITSTVYPDNLVITANGTAGQFNQAFNVTLQDASYHGKRFHVAKNPTAPSNVASDILCILGLTNYSNFESMSVKDDSSGSMAMSSTPSPKWQTPQSLEQHYDATRLAQSGAAGAGQTIGIVTLADFNPSDAYQYWKYYGMNTNPNRISKINVDGGSGLSEATGSDETSLDVEQSGALAPQANVKVYVSPNSDTGFTDAFARAINDDQAQQISCSWGESETIITFAVDQNIETPQYAEVFNELFMQAAAQGQSLFAAAGDSGAYAAERDLGTFDLSTLNPADSPYITATGGTTLPATITNAGTTVTVPTERAWGYDYYFPVLDALGYNNPSSPLYWTNPASPYFEGGGGGFSKFFTTPDYQQGVPGVNSYTGVTDWTSSPDDSTVSRTYNPTVVTGTETGRNLPDISMDADPHTGYGVYFSLPVGDGTNNVDTGWARFGGTSFVAPQLAGLSALINSADHIQVGFWNPQLYRFAAETDSPLHPLNDSGTMNDNDFYTGTPGTIYNQATGLGIPDVAALAESFKANK